MILDVWMIKQKLLENPGSNTLIDRATFDQFINELRLTYKVVGAIDYDNVNDNELASKYFTELTKKSVTVTSNGNFIELSI